MTGAGVAGERSRDANRACMLCSYFADWDLRVASFTL